jgi:hypothetical protein
MNRNTNHEVKEKTMKNLKRLVAAVVLTSVLGLSAFAGESSTPPCTPAAPGESSTPPCSGGQTTSDNSATSGLISTPPSTDSGTGYLVTEAAITLFESLLPLY